MDLLAANPGADAVVDVFLGIILPPAYATAFGCAAGGTPIAFVVASGVVVKCPSDSPSTFPHFIAGVLFPDYPRRLGIRVAALPGRAGNTKRGYGPRRNPAS